MKAWEEEWGHKMYRGELTLVDAHGMMTDTFASFGDGDEEGEQFDVVRARTALASAAPDMARVLREIEWAGQDGNVCPSCGGRRKPAFAEDSGVGHGSSCELDAALRKAWAR